MAKQRRTYVWKDPSRLAGVTVAILVFNAITHGSAAVVDVLFGRSSSYTAEMADLTAPQLLRAIIDVARMVAFLLCASTLIWIVRANRNAHTLRPGLKTSSFWSIGWYVVPFASLFKPFEVMSEIWSASAGAGEGKTRLLGVWWAAFLINGLLGIVWNRTLDDPTAPLAIDFAYAAGSVVVSVIFIQIVRRITRMQVAKHMIADTFGDPEPPRLGALEQVAS